jgi:hypothetical protein
MSIPKSARRKRHRAAQTQWARSPDGTRAHNTPIPKPPRPSKTGLPFFAYAKNAGHVQTIFAIRKSKSNPPQAGTIEKPLLSVRTNSILTLPLKLLGRGSFILSKEAVMPIVEALETDMKNSLNVPVSTSDYPEEVIDRWWRNSETTKTKLETGEINIKSVREQFVERGFNFD